MDADFLLLADAAQVQGDKLYLLGGAWSFVWAREFPVSHPTGIAAGIMVAWDETNTRHRFQLEARNDDSQTVIWRSEGEFEQGRPPGIPAGISQRVLMAYTVALNLPAPGDYVVEIAVDGLALRRSSFKALLQR